MVLRWALYGKEAAPPFALTGCYSLALLGPSGCSLVSSRLAGARALPRKLEARSAEGGEPPDGTSSNLAHPDSSAPHSPMQTLPAIDRLVSARYRAESCGAEVEVLTVRRLCGVAEGVAPAGW